MTLSSPRRFRGLRSRMIGTFVIATFLWVSILVLAAILGLKLGLGEGINETMRTIRLIEWTQDRVAAISARLEAGRGIDDLAPELFAGGVERSPEVRIIAPDGRILVDSAWFEEHPEGETIAASRPEGERFISVGQLLGLIPASDPAEPLPGTAVQIRVDGEIWGYMVLTFAPGEEVYRFVSEPDELVRVLSITLLAGLLLSLLAVYLTFYRFARRIVSPLSVLAEQVARIGEGEMPDREAWPERSDEIGRLAAALDHMASSLAASQESLKRANERRRLLISALGHDLRTPVAAIISHAEAIENGAATDADASLSTIKHRAEHMQQLVEDLLAYAAVGSTGPGKPTRVDLGELARETVISTLPRIEQAGIRIEVDIPDERVEVIGACRALQRVLDNLLENALEHGSAGGWIAIHLRESDRSVSVTVEDRGEGIPEDIDIFEPFRKGSAARSGTGSGLGLAIVREIVTRHGGSCGAKRRHGGGSVVWFELPGGDDGYTI